MSLKDKVPPAVANYKILKPQVAFIRDLCASIQISSNLPCHGGDVFSSSPFDALWVVPHSQK